MDLDRRLKLGLRESLGHGLKKRLVAGNCARSSDDMRGGSSERDMDVDLGKSSWNRGLEN